MAAEQNTAQDAPTELDALVIGAGFAGMYTLHRLRDKLGLSVQVCEAGSDVGGTWYWNRYPGARCDSESAYYMFTDHLSKEILQEWTWSERYAAQPEILSYLRFVADRMDLRRDIRFDTRVTSAWFDEAAARWVVTTDRGERFAARFLITGVGCLSKPFKPKLPGLENFSGECCHTAEWPRGGIDFSGKRVAVIGTGATAVQVVPEIAPDAAHLYVFQRTPSHDLPGRNFPLDEAAAAQIKGRYDEIWSTARNSFGGFPVPNPQTSALEVSDEERRRRYDAAWEKGGLGFGFGTFGDLLLSKEANDTAVAYFAERIHEIVDDPQVADRLTPKYPFFTKRPPLEHGYYEAFNRANVTLVDVRETPIEAITAAGIRTSDDDFPVDVIILATGFDAMTGTLFDIDIRGRQGLPLKDKWADGPRTYLGLTTAGFPNLFMISGPQSPSVLTNMPVSIEQHVEWIADCIAYLNGQGIDSIEPTP
ncbi:MAG: NAD(P)/FAD-dependent oxidoreductase, partial [Pseudomonadota bacterium]|nr:NAD(P)/FAD-dependent oxidoreductase [Pseudomonadota bacterium]